MNKQPLKVTDLDVSASCLKTLKLNNIEYLGELTQYSLIDLANFKAINRTTICMIIKKLKENDMSLHGEAL
jgi:DNA-directed RNA polymerase alpha subunit